MSDEVPSWWPLKYDTVTPKKTPQSKSAPGVNFNFNGELYCVIDWTNVDSDPTPLYVWTGTVEEVAPEDRQVFKSDDLLEILCVLIDLEKKAYAS